MFLAIQQLNLVPVFGESPILRVSIGDKADLLLVDTKNARYLLSLTGYGHMTRDVIIVSDKTGTMWNSQVGGCRMRASNT